jgi:hypothetical protein
LKVSLLFFGLVMSLLLAGCGARPYVDVKSGDYATLQLVPKSETVIFTDDFYVFIDDFSKGCDDIGEMGIVKTDSDTKSRVVKLPVDKPLRLSAYYKIESFNETYKEYTQFMLTPEKNRHYIVEYMRKDISLFETMSDFDVYMQEGDKKMDIPASRIRELTQEEAACY